MHRHGYRGTKFGRERDQRRALLRSLAESLIVNQKIETTLPKAKAVVSFTERLITKSKKGTLHARRQVVSTLANVSAANILIDEITPKLSARTSGYFRIKKQTNRRGDNALTAVVSFVDDLSKTSKPAEEKAKKAKKSIPKKTVSEKISKTSSAPKAVKKISAHSAPIKESAKRAGVRGNK